MRFHSNTAPAMFTSQYQSAAAAEHQLAILQQAQDYILKQPTASLDDQPVMVDILQLLRHSFSVHFQPSLALFQSTTNRLIALPSPPEPAAMDPIAVYLTEICMLGNNSTAIMNGTWKCFMKLIAKHPHSFSNNSVEFMFLGVLYSLYTKVRRADVNIQATTIYIKFFSSHLTTLLRLFPKQLSRLIPYILRILALIRRTFPSQSPVLGQPLESCYSYALRADTEFPRRKLLRFMFEFPTPITAAAAAKFENFSELKPVEDIALLIDKRELASIKCSMIIDILASLEIIDDYAVEGIFYSAHQLSRQHLIDSYEALLNLLVLFAHCRPMLSIFLRWILVSSNGLCAQLFSDAFLLVQVLAGDGSPTALVNTCCDLIDLIKHCSANGEACKSLSVLLARSLRTACKSEVVRRQIINHINGLITSNPSNSTDLIESVALARWLPLRNLFPATMESTLQSKLLCPISRFHRLLELNPQRSRLALYYCENILRHPSVPRDHPDIMKLQDCCLKSLGSTTPMDIQTGIVSVLAKIATSLEEHSFVRCLKLITELMLRSKDLSLFYVAGDFLRHSAMYPGQKFKPASSIHFVNFTTAFFKATVGEEWIRPVYRNLIAYMFSVVSEIPADYVFESRIMETWIRYAERITANQSIAAENYQRFQADPIGLALFGQSNETSPHLTASQLAKHLNEACRLLLQFDPDEMENRGQLVSLQQSMEAAQKAISSILPLI